MGVCPFLKTKGGVDGGWRRGVTGRKEKRDGKRRENRLRISTRTK